METLTCISCLYSIPCEASLKNWKCQACSQQQSPNLLQCVFCGLRGGLMLESDSGWVHMLCVQLLKPYITHRSPISSFEDFLHSSVSVSPFSVSECFLCKRTNDFPVVKCSLCMEEVHIACALEKNWLIHNTAFICGCQRRKVLPAVRNPTSPAIVQTIMNEITELDYLAFFEDEKPSKQSKKSIGILRIPLKVNKSHSRVYEILPAKRLPAINNNMTRKKQKVFDPKSLDMISPNNIYTAQQLISDINELVQNRLLMNPEYSAYIEEFRTKAIQIAKKNELYIKKAVIKDWKSLISNNELATQVLGEWKKQPLQSRPYKPISDYYSAEEETCPLSKLSTRKKGRCNGKFCDNLNSLGPLELSKDTWQSQNTDRKQKIECGAHCKCNAKTCKNRQISHKNTLKLNSDVREQPTWGFDNYTYRSMLAYTLSDRSYTHTFVSDSLPKALNAVSQKNYDIRNALELILTDSSGIFSSKDKTMAYGVLRALEGLISIFSEREVLSRFKVHSKGIGVVSLRKEGIPANSLITEYFGEIFSPARWYEKQDVIKNHIIHLRKKNKTIEQEFYNIILEKHKDDPSGYDVVIIDPIVKGNYASRLSHCCTPNCETVTMVANGRYVVGMYALKPIKYLEELTFDYHSYTDNFKEQLRAVCLCASSQCRNYYMDYAANGSDTPGNFLSRLVLALKCTELPLSKEMIQKMHSFGIRSAILNDCPKWLQVWVALVCQSIEAESASKKSVYEQKSVTDNRLLNLVMTTDKIKYCLRGETHKPYRKLNESEIFEHLWGNSEHSVKTQVARLKISQFKQKKLFTKPARNVREARFLLLKLRDELKKIGNNQWNCQGLADVIHLIAFTKVFYTEIPYEAFKKTPIPIMNYEVHRSFNRNVHKVYSKTHIHGTMTGWFKQTVDQPGASYSAEKRGTVSLPYIQTFKIPGKYTSDVRKCLFEHLRTKHSSTWPIKKIDPFPWISFNNPSKVFGTPMFDQEYFSDNSIERCLRFIDLPAEECELV